MTSQHGAPFAAPAAGLKKCQTLRPFEKCLTLLVMLGACVGPVTAAPAALETPHSIEQLSDADHTLVRALLARVDPLITRRKTAATINLLTFEELYEPLTDEQRAFLDWMRTLTPAQVGGVAVPLGPPRPDIVIERVEPQAYTDSAGKRLALDPQYLPRHVAAAYRRMMDAMARDIGQRLLVESGYRAPAYQLYLFCFYLTTNHHDSIRETNRFVALPGYSEHGAPQRQAIDFISEHGINGDGHPEAFEALSEYRWLVQHAREYGFVLSYPRDNALATSFEPWHWHYESVLPE